MTIFRRFLTLALLVGLCAWPSVVFACEGCKSSAQSGGAPNAIGEAFGVSIYFMLGVLTLLITSLVRMIVRQCRALDAQHALVLAPVAVAVEHPCDDLGGMGAAIPVR